MLSLHVSNQNQNMFQMIAFKDFTHWHFPLHLHINAYSAKVSFPRGYTYYAQLEELLVLFESSMF